VLRAWDPGIESIIRDKRPGGVRRGRPFFVLQGSRDEHPDINSYGYDVICPDLVLMSAQEKY
jgi:hypothetical protein